MIPKNKTETIQVLAIDSGNDALTGLTVTLTIQRKSDDYFWNGSAFQAGATTVAMTETDSTNLAGVYEYDFDMSGLDADRYTLYATTAGAAVNKPWTGTLSTNLNDLATTDIGSISTEGATEGTIAGDIEIAKKVIANDLSKSGSTVTIKENNGTDTFKTYTTSTTQRTEA